MNKKIIFYGVSAHLGGAERSLLDFLRYYKTTKPYDFFVLLPKEEGPLIERLDFKKIDHKTLHFPYLWIKLSRQSPLSILLFLIFGLPSYIIYLFQLVHFLKMHSPKVIHSTGIKCHISLCLISSFLDCKIVIHFRDMMNSTYLQKFFLFFKNRKNIEWITASKAISESIPMLTTEVVYCGFPQDKYFPNRNHFLHNYLNLPESSKLVGLVGVIAKWKGQTEFILAANEVLKSKPDYHFVIVGGQIYDTAGEKGYFASLQKLVKDLKHEKNIHFVPFQKDPALIYNSLDLLTHCSIQPEPFGRVIVEAMFCDTPVIISAAGGALEIVKDDTYGWQHRPGDTQDLARQILACLEDRELQKKAKIAANLVRQDYSVDKCFSVLKNLLEK